MAKTGHGKLIMTWQNYLIYLVSTCLISMMPGSNMILAFQFGLNYGTKKTLWSLAGLSTGLFLLLSASLLGLGIINTKAPFLLTVVKVLGALYLAYLGLQTWRQSATQLSTTTAQTTPTPLQLFRTGMGVSLSNPKAILFFAAFFPKFINFKAPLWSQYIVLTIGLFVSETIWQLIYTSGGKKLSGWLDVGERLLWLNRGCGVIFMLIAIALLVEVAGNIF